MNAKIQSIVQEIKIEAQNVREKVIDLDSENAVVLNFFASQADYLEDLAERLETLA